MNSNNSLRILAVFMVAVLLSSLVCASNGKFKGQSVGQEVTIVNPNEDKSNGAQHQGNPDTEKKNNGENNNGKVELGQGSNNQGEEVKIKPQNAIMPLLPPPAASNPKKDTETKVIIIPIVDEPEIVPCPIQNPPETTAKEHTKPAGNTILPIINTQNPYDTEIKEQTGFGIENQGEQKQKEKRGNGFYQTPIKQEESKSEKSIPAPTKTEVRIIREVLRFANEEKINENTVQKLIKRQTEDSVSYNEITNTTNELVDGSEEKEVFVDEVINMDKRFVNKFSEAAKEERPKIKDQVKEYIKSVKQQKAVKVELKSEQIQDLFSGKMDIDSLMEQLWNS